jgi:mono/diheme cytochrome c family protein
MLRHWNHRLSISWLIAVGAYPALSQQGPADLTRGQELAANMCSFCHDVTRDQSSQSLDEVPSFVRIASKPYQSSEALAELIIFPHPDMPKVSFTATDLRDIIAYIMSLKTKN